MQSALWFSCNFKWAKKLLESRRDVHENEAVQVQRLLCWTHWGPKDLGAMEAAPLGEVTEDALAESVPWASEARAWIEYPWRNTEWSGRSGSFVRFLLIPVYGHTEFVPHCEVRNWEFSIHYDITLCHQKYIVWWKKVYMRIIGHFNIFHFIWLYFYY